MKYAPIIDVLASRMGSIARVCTRYNKEQVIDTIGPVAVAYRSTKIVVVDYDGGRLSFILKAMQIDGECSTMSLPEILNIITETSLKGIVESDTSFKQFPDARQALMHSGLNSSYLSILRGIETDIRNNMISDNIIFGASSSFTQPQILLLFHCDNCVIALQFQD